MSKLLKAYDRSRVPLYVQVASVLRQRIESGRWAPGQKIATLVELEQEFEVARVTVRHAIDLLCEEGLLVTRQGRGTFVRQHTGKDKHWLRLATDWDILTELIRDNVPKPIRVNSPPPFPALGEDEGRLAPDYVYLRSVQFKDGDPYGVVSLHLARPIFDRNPEAFRERTALPVLAGLKDIGIRHAHQNIVIGSADPETADLLRIALGAPTAQCRLVVLDHAGIAIYVADIVYRSDAVKLHVDLLPGASPSKAAGPPAGSRRHGGNGRRRAVAASGLVSSRE